MIDTLRLGGDPAPGLGERWKQVPFALVPELMVFEGGALWLFRRLRTLGIFEALPGDFGDRLKQHAFSTSAVGLRVEDEAVTTLQLLGDAGVPVVLIKGIARRALASRFPYLDARPTSDVDLLLPDAAIREAHDLLRANGYEPRHNRPDEHHHLPGLMGERKVSVELHRSTSVRIPPDVAWARATEGGAEVEWAGLRVRVPSATEMAWAAVTHAINGGLVSGFRLQHFLEVSALAARPESIDWSLMARRCREGETFDEYSGVNFPDSVTEGWIGGACRLVASPPPPGLLPDSAFDLETLLSWRLKILGDRNRLGRAFTQRLLEEGARSHLGVGQELPPPGTGAIPRWRRRVAGAASRLAFRVWKTGRGG